MRGGRRKEGLKPVVTRRGIEAWPIEAEAPANGYWRELTPEELEAYGFDKNLPERIKKAREKKAQNSWAGSQQSYHDHH